MMSDFFKKTQVDEWWGELSPFDFDYLIYMYYLIIYQGFQVLDCGIRCEISAAELTSDKEFEILSHNYETMKFYCLSRYMASRLPNQNVFITLHSDREPLTKEVMVKNYKWLIKGGLSRTSKLLAKWSQAVSLDYRR